MRPMSLKIMVEMRSVKETIDEEGLFARSKSRSKLVCYYCDKLGHKKSDCQNFTRDQKARKVRLDQIKHRREEKSITVIAS